MGDPQYMAIRGGPSVPTDPYMQSLRLRSMQIQRRWATVQEANRIPTPAQTPLLPQIVSEEVATYAQKRARKRRGLGSTILTGDMTVDPASIGKKALLGS